MSDGLVAGWLSSHLPSCGHHGAVMLTLCTLLLRQADPTVGLYECLCQLPVLLLWSLPLMPSLSAGRFAFPSDFCQVRSHLPCPPPELLIFCLPLGKLISLSKAWGLSEQWKTPWLQSMLQIWFLRSGL